MHRSEQNLLNKVNQASAIVEIGSIYYHYKDIQREKPYLIIAIALREDNEEPTVIYQAQYGNNLTWERTLASWMEKIDGHESTRFTRLENSI